MKVLLIAALLIATTCSIKWEGTNANGHTVLRTFNVLKSPAKGNPDTFTVLATQREVNAAGKKSKIQDAIELTFSVLGLPHFVVRYFERSTDTVELSAIRHGLRKLVEYIPGANVSAGFLPGNNTVVQERYFWKGVGSNWSQLKVGNSTVSGANVISVCSTNDIGVTICFYAADIWTELTVNGSEFKIDPNAIHHTLDISNFPFKANGSQLALKVHFEEKTRAVPMNKSDPALDPNEDALDLSDPGETVRPVAAWQDTVNVTGSGCSPQADVVRSVIYSSDIAADLDVGIDTAMASWTGEVSINLVMRIVYFSFLTDCNQPTDIFWDPDMGVIGAGESSGASFLIPSLLLSSIMLLLSMFMFRY